MSETVGHYYDQLHESYLRNYGRIVQAFRPKSDKELIKYLIQSAQIRKGQQVLDAGCGYGAVDLALRTKLRLNILGISISERQIELARQNTPTKYAQDLRFERHDYHHLAKVAKPESLDRILFLESLGHANDVAGILKQCFGALKKGGKVYIKDFYKKQSDNADLQAKFDFVISNINQAYQYQVMQLHQLVLWAMQAGFEIDFIKKFDFQDDVTIRTRFEQENGIRLYGDDLEFPAADWLEVLLVKPAY